MASVDNLPGDQRAVLQLVLGRGRSYDQIAGMLSINPTSVRERAHAAIDALGPETDVSPENRGLIADYLLGQLSGPEEAVRALDLLEGSAPDRAWARVVASELSPLGSGALPEIPTEGSGRGAPEPAAAASPPPPPAAAPAPEPEPVEPAVAAAPGPRLAPSDPTASAGDEAAPGAGRRGAGGPGGGGGRRSSRLGGAILIAAVVVAAIVVAVVLLTSGSNSPPHQTAADRSATTSSTPASSASAGSSSATTATTSANTSASAKVVAQINLAPTAKGSKAAGIAEVLNEGSSQGIAIVADNVPPNKTAPHPNAYAVWLYNSPGDAKILGFVNPGVGSNGKLQTAGALPSNASRYKQLIVTVETQAKPAKPGTIILRGPLTGLS